MTNFFVIHVTIINENARLKEETLTSETFGVNSRDQNHCWSVFKGFEFLAELCCSLVPKVELHHRAAEKTRTDLETAER